MERATPPSSILPEILKKDNYERWSILMEHYLKLQDLWGVVQSPRMPKGEDKREWIKKNDLALYAIRISCGIEAFDRIKEIRSAKAAWDALAVMLKAAVVEEVTPNILIELGRESRTENQERLYKYISDGDLSSAKKFLRNNRDARSPETLEYALRIAITHGDNNMARYFYCEIPRDFLQGNRSFFLLEECITMKMFDIAFDLLHHFRELAFTCPLGSIPIILTLAQTPPPFLRQNELGLLGRWMYNCTRVKVFKPGSNPGGRVSTAQGQPRKWILALYKFHLVGVLIGLQCWFPAMFSMEAFLFEVSSLLIVMLLKLDPAGILTVAPLLQFVPLGLAGLGIAFGAMILFLVILRSLDLSCGPIGMPLLVLGAVIWLIWTPKDLSILLLALFSLTSLPLLMFAFEIYNLKLMDAFANEVIREICELLSNLDVNQFVQSRAVEATFQAIKNGIPAIVIELITKANDAKIPWSSSYLEGLRTMFAYAIANRREKVAHFLHEFGASKDIKVANSIDEDENTSLHLTAKLAHHSQLDCISSAALQLQNELHWFKSMEGIVPRSYNNQPNKEGETPLQVFSREHGYLLREAEEWMKKVAKSSTVVGALVITIMFAAGFTIPGGNNQETGFPIFLNKPTRNNQETGFPKFLNQTAILSSTTSFTVVPFVVFIVSDAISLFAASSSVLIFMGMLVTRYTFPDFHISLPIKLIVGLSSLSISIGAMMVAFCTTIFMMLHDLLVIVIPIIFLAAVPVTLFIFQQSPLLVEIYTLTFRKDIFYRRGYFQTRMRFSLSLNRRWWFRTIKGRMVVMLCAFVLLYVTWYIYFAYQY